MPTVIKQTMALIFLVGQSIEIEFINAQCVNKEIYNDFTQKYHVGINQCSLYKTQKFYFGITD